MPFPTMFSQWVAPSIRTGLISLFFFINCSNFFFDLCCFSPTETYLGNPQKLIIASLRHKVNLKRSTSSLLSISVIIASPVTCITSAVNFVFSRSISLIFSSMVPFVMNLCTMTFFLADTKRPVRRLVLNCGIPPSVKMNHVICLRQIQANPPLLAIAPCKEYTRCPEIVPQAFSSFLRRCCRAVPVRRVRISFLKMRAKAGYLLKLGEDQYLLPFFVDRFTNFA